MKERYGRIKGNPFIIRFKTLEDIILLKILQERIKGNPFIIRFKTTSPEIVDVTVKSIKGNPFIIRFKTKK